jgi:ribA/ribD-fused uncharacterized protein
MINSFRGEYNFLSNFFPCEIVFEGLTYHSVEAAFQAAKCAPLDDRSIFCNLDAATAKRIGRAVDLREDWEQVKLSVMKTIIREKFFSDKYLGVLLLSTGYEDLVEGNDWNDTFWGVSNRTGVGQNHLGKILMEVRNELRA